jgi:hypothetical protein
VWCGVTTARWNKSPVPAYLESVPHDESSTPLHTLLNRLFALLLPAVGLVITIVAVQDLSWDQRILAHAALVCRRLPKHIRRMTAGVMHLAFIMVSKVATYSARKYL